MTVDETYKYLFAILEAKGFGTSVTSKLAVDAEGNPLPWFSYPSIDYLRGIDLQQTRVFEFGAGCSTLFWSKRCRQIVSVESDRQWFSKLSSVRPSNCQLFLRETEQAYLDLLDETPGVFDIIVIDGAMNRRKMAERAISRLAQGGFVILDNSDCHVHAAKVLRDSGLIQIDFVGFAPVNHFEQATSFFLTRDFRPKPAGEWQPTKSIGAMAHFVTE